MKIEQTECSETSAYKFQTPGNNPEESIKYINPHYLFRAHGFTEFPQRRHLLSTSRADNGKSQNCVVGTGF